MIHNTHRNNIDSLLQKAEKSIDSLGSELNEDLSSVSDLNDRLDSMIEAVRELSKQSNIGDMKSEELNITNVTTSDINTFDPTVKNKDYRFDQVEGLECLSPIDVAVTCLAGGIAVLVDFLVVKIPKTTNIVRNGQAIPQDGSPLTKLIRKIGLDEDGKASKWVDVLERLFKVNYDKSIIAGEKVFTPKTHRLLNLAHDPTPVGFLFALKDIICGTMTYVDGSGVIKVIPADGMSLNSKLIAPVLWVGHLLSDIFTRMGVPIPGGSLLQILHFGSFGEKRRTIAEVARYMYLDGYDLRHLFTMSSCNACIEILLWIHHLLTRKDIRVFGRPMAIVESDRNRQKLKMKKMHLGAYSVATCGNIVKLASYQWNPTAFNLAVWSEFLRLSIQELRRKYGEENDYLEILRNRENIDYRFENLKRRINEL